MTKRQPFDSTLQQYLFLQHVVRLLLFDDFVRILESLDGVDGIFLGAMLALSAQSVRTDAARGSLQSVLRLDDGRVRSDGRIHAAAVFAVAVHQRPRCLRGLHAPQSRLARRRRRGCVDSGKRKPSE